MKAIYGVAECDRMKSRSTVRVSVEIPIECWKQAVAEFDGQTVLVTLHNLGDRPYGIVSNETDPNA